MKKILLDALDLGKVAHLSLAQAYRLLSREDLPVVNIGGERYMHRDRFKAWLADHSDGQDILEDR